MVYNAGNIGGSVYVNNVVGGALDVGSSLLIFTMLKKISRRNSLAILFIVFAFVSILTPPIRQGKLMKNVHEEAYYVSTVESVKIRLLNPPRIKSKTGCPEVDLLTEFHFIFLL